MKTEFLKNCWEIRQCGREKGGIHESLHGQCPASRLNMGHSCWAVAGSFHNGTPFCPRVRDEGEKCTGCKIFQMYSRTSGQKGLEVETLFPEEAASYNVLMVARWEQEQANKNENNTAACQSPQFDTLSAQS